MANDAVHMSIDEFMKEQEEACNLGFMHGADMVLRLSKMIIPKKDYEQMAKAVHECELYVAGKKVKEVSSAWAKRKRKEQ